MNVFPTNNPLNNFNSQSSLKARLYEKNPEIMISSLAKNDVKELSLIELLGSDYIKEIEKNNEMITVSDSSNLKMNEEKNNNLGLTSDKELILLSDDEERHIIHKVENLNNNLNQKQKNLLKKNIKEKKKKKLSKHDKGKKRKTSQSIEMNESQSNK